MNSSKYPGCFRLMNSVLLSARSSYDNFSISDAESFSFLGDKLRFATPTPKSQSKTKASICGNRERMWTIVFQTSPVHSAFRCGNLASLSSGDFAAGSAASFDNGLQSWKSITPFGERYLRDVSKSFNDC